MFQALCDHHQEVKIILSGIITSSHPVGGRPVHRTATYKVWRYQMLYNAIWPHDDKHNSARNMYRHIINLLQKKNLCSKLVNYWDYTEMHGQQNIKILDVLLIPFNKRVRWINAGAGRHYEILL